MESEVAATLCAAYPEVDPSVVALVLAETGGDAGEAARQLAVLVSDTHNQLAGEPRPSSQAARHKDDDDLALALQQSRLLVQSQPAHAPGRLPAPVPPPPWPPAQSATVPSAPPWPRGTPQPASGRGHPPGTRPSAGMGGRGMHSAPPSSSGRPQNHKGRPRNNAPPRPPKAPHNLTGGPSRCWFAAWHADGRVVPVAPPEVAVNGGVLLPAEVMAGHAAASDGAVAALAHVPAIAVDPPVAAVAPAASASVLDLGWDAASAASWDVPVEEPASGGGDDNAAPSSGAPAQHQQQGSSSSSDDGDVAFLRDLFPSLPLDMASLVAALGRDEALKFCFDAMAGCDAGMLPTSETGRQSREADDWEHLVMVLCTQFPGLEAHTCVAALEDAGGQLEAAAAALEVARRAALVDASCASDAALAQLTAQFADLFDAAVLRRTLRDAGGDVGAAVSTLSAAHAARWAEQPVASRTGAATAFTAALVAASTAADGTSIPPPLLARSGGEVYARVRAQQQSHFAAADQERRNAQAAAAMGDRAAAVRHAQAAREAARCAREAGAAAADATLAANNTGQLNFYTVDLHALHVGEALREVAKVMDIYCTHLRGIAHLRFITGRGAHSTGGVARIQPAVCNLLQSRRVAFDVTANGGAVEVTVSDGVRAAWLDATAPAG